MKNQIIIYISLFIIVSCKPKLDEFKPSFGNADFRIYVALGNSLTSGYANGALYISGQENSYPNILAQQFAKVGGGSFKQPLMADENGIGFNGTTPVTKLVLTPTTDCMGATSLSPKNISNSPNLANFSWIGNQGPYNNLGVPGAKSFHLLAPQLGNSNPSIGNPFYARFATNPGTSTVLGDALAQSPTFFTIWIGNNDALLYALGGGDQSSDSITAQIQFNFSLDSTLKALTANKAKGAIANIPDITSIPYFTTVPYNGLVLTDQSQVTALNSAYAAAGITFNLGANPFIIKDASAPAGFRQIKSSEYILLTVPQDSLKCYGLGSQIPIPGKYVLDSTEVSKVETAISGYNSSISSFANSFNLAFVDANSVLNSLKSGITYNGVTFTTTFVTGGAFSLDGIHLTPRGYAVIANKFIESINAKYGANVPQVSVTNYAGIEFP